MIPNPFDITKAVDFTDREISDYWVDMPGGEGFMQLTKPTSPMPMLILGGKGSGKTHVMRYFSYATQKIWHADSVIDGIRSDGYIGIYLRCSGLNAARFAGKGQSDDVWASLFPYYMDLWLSQLLLVTVQDALASADQHFDDERAICQRVVELFASDDAPVPQTVPELIEMLRRLHTEVDMAVNNCALTSHLDVRILVGPGGLVFGIPRILAEAFAPLHDIQFLYLIDELENLSAEQQKYVQTLVREKVQPSSFKLGARLYGVKTYATYGGEEENKEGSEYECLRLDERLRAKAGTRGAYRKFALDLCFKRLQEGRYVSQAPKSANARRKYVESCFETLSQEPGDDPFGTRYTAFVLEKCRPEKRPHWDRLTDHLRQGGHADAAPGVTSDECAARIVSLLSCPQHPLLEKTNIFLLYQQWFRTNCGPRRSERSTRW